MENKQQVLEEMLNNEVYELVGADEAGSANLSPRFEGQQRGGQSAQPGRGVVEGCGCAFPLVWYMQWAQMVFCFLEET